MTGVLRCIHMGRESRREAEKRVAREFARACPRENMLPTNPEEFADVFMQMARNMRGRRLAGGRSAIAIDDEGELELPTQLAERGRAWLRAKLVRAEWRAEHVRRALG